MTRADLIDRLIALPNAIAEAEMALLTLEEQCRIAKEALQQVEDALLLDPERITGKNAEQRAAQLRAETGAERDQVVVAEYEVSKARLQVRFLTNEMWALKDVARLLGAADE
jgi:hypothetical protein